MSNKSKQKIPQLRKNFGYEIVKTISLEEGISLLKSLPNQGKMSRKYKLATLSEVSTKCTCCPKIGTNFSLGIQCRRSEHWDLYDDNGNAFTLDHIVPKSKGGSNAIDNLQIMCYTCNLFKGNDPNREMVCKLLNSNGYGVTPYLSGDSAFLRINYWEKISDNILNLISDYVTEEVIDDEDCGTLFTYYIKSNKTRLENFEKNYQNIINIYKSELNA